MSANTDKCADKDKTVCDYNEFRRLRYFHGMLLDDKDFQAEQQYHAGKRRLLNRMLHGSGVVCGLDLKGKKDGRWIEITSGLALDCSGNEIWVPKKQHIDLASLLPPKDKPKNPECREDDDNDELKTYYIGIRYEEKPTNPVSVYLPSGSCEEKTCENSRYKEGFCIEIVDCCPEKYPPGLIKNWCECEKADQPDTSWLLCGDCGEMPDAAAGRDDAVEAWCKCVRLEEFCSKSIECSECCSCDKPCFVVLGQIKVDQDCRLQAVCANECRKYVLTGRMVQQMALGLFAGSEDLFYADLNGQEIPIPDVGEAVNNPIKLLCWVLRNLVLQPGEFKRHPCDPSTPPPPPPPPPPVNDPIFRALQAQVETLTQKHNSLQERLNLIEKPRIETKSNDTAPLESKPTEKTPKK